MPEPVNPIRPTDDDARALARALLSGARHAALAVLHPDTGAPFVSRIALGQAPGGAPVTPFMQAGDTVRIWMDDDRHHPIFGVIEQTVVAG